MDLVEFALSQCTFNFFERFFLLKFFQYDLEFVTFLRGMLSIGGGEEQLSWHRYKEQFGDFFWWGVLLSLARLL